MTIRSYSELVRFDSFNERFNYLKLFGSIGSETFGFDRYLNQVLYHSAEWKHTRNLIIIRDDACDLGMRDCPIVGGVYIHHMNPITKDMILHRDPDLFNPEYLICVSFKTHNMIHYGGEPDTEIITRCKNDTIPWRT